MTTVDFYAKTFPILYPCPENSTTGNAINVQTWGCLKITLAQKWQNPLIDFLAKSWCRSQFINILLSLVNFLLDCEVTELWFNASTKVLFGLGINSRCFEYVYLQILKEIFLHDFLQKIEILPIVSKKGAQVGWQSAGHSTRNRGLNYFFNIIHIYKVQLCDN